MRLSASVGASSDCCLCLLVWPPSSEDNMLPPQDNPPLPLFLPPVQPWRFIVSWRLINPCRPPPPRHASATAQPSAGARRLALDALRNLCKDSAVAPVVLKANLLPAVVPRLVGLYVDRVPADGRTGSEGRSEDDAHGKRVKREVIVRVVSSTSVHGRGGAVIMMLSGAQNGAGCWRRPAGSYSCDPTRCPITRRHPSVTIAMASTDVCCLRARRSCSYCRCCSVFRCRREVRNRVHWVRQGGMEERRACVGVCECVWCQLFVCAYLHGILALSCA